MTDVTTNLMKAEEKIKEAYVMIQEGMPLNSVAQVLDLPVKDIAHLYDYSA